MMTPFKQKICLCSLIWHALIRQHTRINKLWSGRFSFLIMVCNRCYYINKNLDNINLYIFFISKPWKTTKILIWQKAEKQQKAWNICVIAFGKMRVVETARVSVNFRDFLSQIPVLLTTHICSHKMCLWYAVHNNTEAFPLLYFIISISILGALPPKLEQSFKLMSTVTTMVIPFAVITLNL